MLRVASKLSRFENIFIVNKKRLVLYRHYKISIHPARPAVRQIKLANLRRSSSPRRSFSGMDRHRLWARAATVPAPICRACTCRRVMVSWMVLALASGRICCLREHCARVTAARSVAVEPSCLGQTALAAAVRRLGPSPRNWICVRDC